MSEIYDKWERLVAAVVRKEKDRELCYQSSLPSDDDSSYSISSSSSPVIHGIVSIEFSSSHHHQQPLIAKSSLKPSRIKKVVLKVDLDKMKKIMRGTNFLSKIGICFVAGTSSGDVKAGTSPFLDKARSSIIKAACSVTAVESVALAGEYRDKLIVTGDIDAVALVRKLSKLCYIDIVSVLQQN